MKKLIKTSKLIDCTGAATKENWSLLVEDGLISAVGPHGQFDGKDISVEDMTDGVVMAGFIDMHAHFCYTTDAGFQQAALQPNRVAMLDGGFKNAEEWLYQGVTTARNVGTPFDLDMELNRALESGLAPGPRMVCAGRMMTMVGGRRTPWDYMKEEINGVEEARQFARRHLERGVDVIKLYCTTLLEANVADYLTRVLSLPEDAPDPGRWSSLTEEEISAVCEEMHKVGRTVSAHVAPTFGIKIALRGGVDTIEHGTNLDQECIDLFLEHDATLVPTLNVMHYQIVNSEEIEAPPVYAEFSRRQWQNQIEMLAKAHEAGVRIATGTDSVIDGMQYYSEVELLVTEVGLEPSEALLCATRNGALGLGKAGETLGSLDIGKSADMVLLAEDPLEEIGNIRQIKKVFKAGEIVARPLEHESLGKGGHIG